MRMILLHFANICILCYAAGSIPISEVLFGIGACLYIFLFLSRWAFPSFSPTKPPNVYEGNKLLLYYVSIGAIFGLFLPLLYSIAGFVKNSQLCVNSVVPHTLLLLLQIIAEQIAFNLNGISLPIRALVPICFNARRIFSIWSWLEVEYGTVKSSVCEDYWIHWGRFIAVSNMVFWCFNLFCFLLPVFLPAALSRYYQEKLKSN